MTTTKTNWLLAVAGAVVLFVMVEVGVRLAIIIYTIHVMTSISIR